MKATFNGQVIAQSSTTHKLDGYHYFPLQAVDMSFLAESKFSTRCPAKGTARYWNIKVGDKSRMNAAFSYPEATPEVKHIEGWIAFWTGDKDNDVKVV